ncbi:hypothetical protein [Candidatus Pantoea deserta]|uniref:hypothetical protein n=1 Tax=Candidatus Pantoea deserta TaxID=1869313 RepID=UPI000F4DB821|nr:hypothetical protein [Pantoea deserta]
MNNFDCAAPAPQDRQKSYAVARVNIAFVISLNFYGQIRAKGAPQACIAHANRASDLQRKNNKEVICAVSQLITAAKQRRAAPLLMII